MSYNQRQVVKYKDLSTRKLKACADAPTLTLLSSVTLDEYLNLSQPALPHLQNDIHERKF